MQWVVGLKQNLALKMTLMSNQPSTASTTKRISEDYLYTKKTFNREIISVENYSKNKSLLTVKSTK